ncbi:hypothetical protein QYF36_022015 [Acer negundo]|nr:hypothetical protein QYF36_022015 [Acer negundo]
MEEEIENLVDMRKGGRNIVFGKYEKNGEVELVRSKSLSNPPFYNAFEFISGSDLSSLLESKRKSGSMFTSKFAASDIMGKLWSEFCRKGKLAEVYEVELSKSAVV